MRRVKVSLIVELLRDVINKVGSTTINKSLKQTLALTYMEIKRVYKVKHKGILTLLSLFGDPETLIKELAPRPPPQPEPEIPINTVESFD